MDKALYLYSQDLGLFPILPATNYMTIVKLILLTSQMKSNGSRLRLVMTSPRH